MTAIAQAHDTVLSVSDLTICFAGAPANVVDGVSFKVRRGKTLAIVGESGCGKSVTSMALMGLLPDTAKIAASASSLLDETLLGMPEERLLNVRGNRMAMIFQEPMTSLNPVFTIGEQIAESVIRHQGLSARTPASGRWICWKRSGSRTPASAWMPIPTRCPAVCVNGQ